MGRKGKKPGARAALEIRIAKMLERLLSPLNFNNMTPAQKIELIDKILEHFPNLSEETIDELTELKASLGGAQSEDSGGSNPPPNKQPPPQQP